MLAMNSDTQVIAARMDSDVQEIITRFKHLSTRTARHSAIHQIIDQLSPYEWRDVKKRIDARSFQKDILGALPLEIAVQVTQSLTLADMHLLRRVSRRWRDVLGSKAACNAMYQQYTGNNLDHLDTDFKSTFARYSEHRLRIERGDPCNLSRIVLPSITDEELSTLDYSDGQFAWTTDSGTTVVVYNLITGGKQRYCTKNRERLGMVRLSQSTVAAITVHGHCHIWSTLTDEVYSAHLPNTDISHFSLADFRVAVCFYTVGNDNGFVMHCDLQSQTSHTIPLEQLESLLLIALHSASRLTMVSLELIDARGSRQLCVTDYGLHADGGASAGRSYRAPLPSDLPLCNTHIAKDLQLNYRNRLGILYAWLGSGEEREQIILPVSYNPQTGSTCVHILQEHRVSFPPCIASVDKDILYYVANDDGKQSIRISNPYAATHYTSKNMALGLPREPSPRLFSHGHRVLIGDSNFVSILDATSTRVWSF
ncbi:hypothetical protein BJX66DRAFT_137345 [Aspergillus keveii]|uniref:F-box domain-containing protein n=1 Tax=Aspergillus keveii TaxID=714993 RepID=A0ABR4GBU3_9EURO